MELIFFFKSVLKGLGGGGKNSVENTKAATVEAAAEASWVD